MKLAAGGAITRLARLFGLRGQRIVLAAQALWIAVVFVLTAWWGHVIFTQAMRIATLEEQLGVASSVAGTHMLRTQRMVFWESVAFFSLLFAASAVLLWLYWRDYRRARAIQAFFASLTHELRTPLTSVRLQAEAIATDVQDPAMSALIQRLLEDTLRLESQVERTLELARVEGGGPVYPQPIPLKRWLSHFVANWIAMAGGRIEVKSLVSDETMIMADPGGLQVIFRNLLENSIRHSCLDEQGSVLVTVGASATNGRICVEYRDNGDGYGGDVKDLGRIFFKGPSSHGAGVGLYLVRVLMERMGGSCIFEKDDGFRVTLLFREAPANA